MADGFSRLNEEAPKHKIFDCIASYICCTKNIKKHEIRDVKESVLDTGREKVTQFNMETEIQDNKNVEQYDMEPKILEIKEHFLDTPAPNISREGKGISCTDDHEPSACRSLEQTAGMVTGSHNMVNSNVVNNYYSPESRSTQISTTQDEAGTSNISARSERRQTSYPENDPYFVGLQDVTQKLLSELRKYGHGLSVIAIYGTGGLGKTCLARKLYNSPEVEGHFPSRAWVCVSNEYKIEELLLEIIKSLKGQPTEKDFELWKKMEKKEDMERHLRHLLESQPYLIVVDDVWRKEVWDYLKKVFPDKTNGSRVIITARNKEIALKAVSSSGIVHELRYLTPNESWELFCKTALPRVGGQIIRCSPAMEKLGRAMLDKCGNLPLAIIVLGGILLHNNSLEAWEQTKDNIWRYLKNESLDIEELLSLSYRDMSYEMQQCFLYVGMFPEDYEIDVDKLIRLWIAEELLQGTHGSMEDMAKDNLNELINRNLIQIAGMLLSGQVYKCRVHDILLNLSLQKAMKANFLGIFNPLKNSNQSNLNHRRHALHSQMGTFLELSSSSHKSESKSLVSFVIDGECLGVEQLKLIYTRFNTLKVLDLVTVKTGAERIPDEIGNLVQLKFLGLIGAARWESCIEIPTTIGNLIKLQSLYGDEYSVYLLPKEICELKELRHLVINFSEFHLNIDRLTNLLTVRTVCYVQWIRIDTTNLKNIRELSITNRSSFYHNARILENISKLESLRVFHLTSFKAILPSLDPLSSCPLLKSVHLTGEIKDPSALSALPETVTHLSLSNSKLMEDPMPMLGKMPNLTSLEMHESYLGEKMICRFHEFLQLELLRIQGLQKLDFWDVQIGAMPKLRALTIHDCPRMKIFPDIVKLVPAISAIYVV